MLYLNARLAAAILGLSLAAGCGLISSDVTNFDLMLPDKKFTIDASGWQVDTTMNPFNNGKPIDDMVMIRKTIAKTGITFEMPPYSEISRVCRRSYSMPTIKKSAPVEMP